MTLSLSGSDAVVWMMVVRALLVSTNFPWDKVFCLFAPTRGGLLFADFFDRLGLGCSNSFSSSKNHRNPSPQLQRHNF